MARRPAAASGVRWLSHTSAEEPSAAPWSRSTAGPLPSSRYRTLMPSTRTLRSVFVAMFSSLPRRAALLVLMQSKPAGFRHLFAHHSARSPREVVSLGVPNPLAPKRSDALPALPDPRL